MFGTCIAIDPSLWWNNRKLIDSAAQQLHARPDRKTVLFLASSDEPDLEETTQLFANVLTAHAPPQTCWHLEKFPAEKHSTIFHPAALKAFRTVFPLPDLGSR